MKRAPKLVLFDLDGTLANSLEIGLNAMNRLRYVFGYKHLDKNDPRLRQISGPDFVKVFLGLNTTQALAWIILLKWLVGRQAHNIRLFAGILPMMRTLKKNVPVGIVTSAPRRYTQIILKNGKLPAFDVFETNVKYLAKDVRIAKILKRKGLKPRQVLYVGDELRDAQACAKVGVPFLAVDWGKDHADVFRGHPKVGVVAKPSEILRYVVK
jgi:phosphoglycolate phosphatase